MKQKLALAAAGLWILAGSSLASVTPFVTGKGGEAHFRCFEDDHGGFYLVWADSGSGREFSLRSQHIGADGRLLWSPPGVLISSRVTSAEDWSGLADGQGGLTLFWDEADGIRAQRFGAEGDRKREGNSVLMSTSTAIQPCAVPDAVGGTYVVWKEMLPSGRPVVMSQRLAPDGKPLWPGGLRVSLRSSRQMNPTVVPDNMSGLIVAWRDEANSASELRVQRIDFGANRLWTPEGLKIMQPLGTEEFPTIASVGTGSAVIAWNGSARQTSQIYLQKVGPAPALQWGPDGIAASRKPALYNRWNPTLAGDEVGGTWMAWEDFGNQNNYLVRLNHLNALGVSVWPGGEIAVAPAPGDQGKISIATDGQGGVWLAWMDNRLATVGIYAQQVNATGRRLQGDLGRMIADHLNKPSRPEIVSLVPGKAVIAWVDRPRKGEWTLSWALVGTP